MNEIFQSKIDNSAGDLNGERVCQPESPIAQAAPESLSEITDAGQEAPGKRLSGRRGEEHPNWNQSMSEVDQAVAGLASGRYSSMRAASRALGYNKKWLSNLSRRRPDIAERLREACSSPEFKATRAAGKAQDLLKIKAAAVASGRDKDVPWRQQHSAQIKEAVDGMRSGCYGSMSAASVALGFGKNWLNQAGKRNPEIAEMIAEACAAPAFQTAAQKNAAKHQALRHSRRRAENLEKVNQALAGIAGGKYDTIRQAGLALSFSSRWFSEMQRVNPEIAERLRAAKSEAKNHQSATPKAKPRRKKPQKQAGAQDSESDAEGILNSNSVLRWHSEISQMSTTKKIIQIINFWEGNVTVEEVMTELQELGIQNTEQQNIKEQVISLLKRKSRHFKNKH